MAAVTLDEAKAHLNITATTHDEELAEFIDRAEAAITSKCGPLESVATTSRVRGESDILALPEWPVISLTSITPVGGSALTVADYVVTEGGIVEPAEGGWFPSRWYDVVYQAGRTSLPADLMLAVLEMIRHLWDTQRSVGSGRIGAGGDDSTANTMPGAAYLFPFRVSQLMEPYMKAAI